MRLYSLFWLKSLASLVLCAKDPPESVQPIDIFSALQKVSFKSFDDDIDLRDKSTLAKCSSKWASKSDAVKNRFSDAALQQHCQMGARWAKDAKSAPKIVRLLSDDQLNWLRGVWNCKDLLCICRKIPICKRFLEQLEVGFTQMKTFGDQIFKQKTPPQVKGRKNRTSPNNHRKIKRATAPLGAEVQRLLADAVQGKIGMSNRKEIRMMNNEERSTFFKAINQMKTEQVGDKTKYNMLIYYHTPEYSPEAHFCAAFLPFHRQLLNSIEVALREAQPAASLPYWDPTLDQPLPDARDSVIWSDELLGGDGDVTGGPFGNWTTIPDAQVPALSNTRRINRALGASPYGFLLKDSDIDTILSKRTIKDLTYCVDPYLEMTHGATHMWVGGHMLDLRTSPNDPTFFLYHCFLDHVWEIWRRQQQSAAQRISDYPSDADSCNAFCYAQADMKPFPLKNIDGMSNEYVDKVYVYSPRPTCSQQNSDCGSPYLFCDTRKFKCISKVRSKGNCAGFEGQDVCYKSKCIAGRCQPTDVSAQTFAPTFPPVPIESPTQPRLTTPPAPPTAAPTAPPTAAPTAPLTAAPTANPWGPRTIRPPTAPPAVALTTPPAPPTVPPATPSVQPPPTVPTMPAKITEGMSTSGSIQTVWIPITVFNFVDTEARAYPNAVITSTDKAHGAKFTGVVSDPSKVPYYTGAAFAQVISPFSVDDGVQATIEVFDENMQKCESLCLIENTAEYSQCEAKVSLSNNILNSGNVPYTQNFEEARLINWNNNKRSLDKFIFRCRVSRAADETEEPQIILAGTTTAQPAVMTTAQSVVINGANGGQSVQINTVSDNETAGLVNGGCLNMHRCCSIWSGVGECRRNPWMRTNCQKDCGVCKSGLDLTDCSDTDPLCPKWASQKECTLNDEWMEENCKKSCGKCNRNMAQLLVLCGVSGGSEKCIDTDDQCPDWAARRECERNPWWMKENCAVSCKSCKNKSLH